MAEHRVPMLGSALRRRADPARSRDPRVRELVAALGTLEPTPAPRAEFRAELRAQLVAVAPRLVAEGKAQAAAAPTGASQHRARARVSIKKPVFAIIGAACAFVLLLGGAVLLSRGALPGDALYGVKRASEDTEYSLTSGSVDRGKLKLEFAGRRIGEVADLLPKASALAGGSGVLADGGQISANTSKLVRQTLGSADSDVYKAAVLLGDAAVNGKSAGPLHDMTSWTPGQITKMRAILARIPAGSLHDRAAATLAVIEGAQTRASTLQRELGCSCLSTANSDRFGPVPCTTACHAAPPRTGGGSSPGGSSGSGGSGGSSGSARPGSGPGAGGGSGGKPARPGGGTGGGASSGGAGGGAGGAPKPGPTTTKPGLPLPVLPSLPVSLPTPTTSSKAAPPISIDSCGVHATIAGIGIGLGTC